MQVSDARARAARARRRSALGAALVWLVFVLVALVIVMTSNVSVGFTVAAAWVALGANGLALVQALARAGQAA